MDDAERRTALRRLVASLRSTLVYLGHDPDRVRTMSIEELIDARERTIRWLMRAPTSGGRRA